MSGWCALLVCLSALILNCSCRDYPCDDRAMFISVDWFCDGVQDCNDGSDEEGCEVEYITSYEMPSTDVTESDEIENYCALDKRHTMCQFEGPSGECRRMTIFAGLIPEGRKAILDRHNQLRSRVALGDDRSQPKAANMKKLVWSFELEQIAQRWAEQCDLRGQHDYSRSKLDGTSVGQNRAKLASTEGYDTAEILDVLGNIPEGQWYDEVINGFDRRLVRNYRSKYSTNLDTSQYSQMVWAETEEVGCGFVYIKGNFPFNTLLICNYATAGNVENEKVYKIGRHCSACPDGFTGCEDGLCTRPRSTSIPCNRPSPTNPCYEDLGFLTDILGLKSN